MGKAFAIRRVAPSPPEISVFDNRVTSQRQLVTSFLGYRSGLIDAHDIEEEIELRRVMLTSVYSRNLPNYLNTIDWFKDRLTLGEIGRYLKDVPSEKSFQEEEEVAEVAVDDSYIERACKIRWKGRIRINDGVRRSFLGLSDSSFTLGIEYEE